MTACWLGPWGAVRLLDRPSWFMAVPALGRPGHRCLTLACEAKGDAALAPAVPAGWCGSSHAWHAHGFQPQVCTHMCPTGLQPFSKALQCRVQAHGPVCRRFQGLHRPSGDSMPAAVSMLIVEGSSVSSAAFEVEARGDGWGIAAGGRCTARYWWYSLSRVSMTCQSSIRACVTLLRSSSSWQCPPAVMRPWGHLPEVRSDRSRCKADKLLEQAVSRARQAPAVEETWGQVMQMSVLPPIMSRVVAARLDAAGTDAAVSSCPAGCTHSMVCQS